jgi:hypothetical protein
MISAFERSFVVRRLARLCGRRTDHAELGRRNRHYRGGKKAATIVVGFFDHFLPPTKFLRAKTRSFVIS